MSKVAIIGGGFSGVISSIYASKLNEVTILERNNDILKKLLLTGNGRCNFFNSNQGINYYHSNNIDLLDNIINDNIHELINFYHKIGIEFKEKDGYYYPYSNQALSIKNALVNKLKETNTKIVTDYYVESIKKDNNKFIINNEYEFDKVIIATGGSSYPITGSDGNMYSILKELGIKITNIYPALSPLVTDDKYLKELSGVRNMANISFYADDKFIKDEEGELQLTDYGISGICVFNLSYLYNIYKNSYVLINFIPFIKTKEELEKYLDDKDKLMGEKTISELLNGVINNKIINVIIKKSNLKDVKYKNLDKNEKDILIDNIFSYKMNITDIKGFNKSQVTMGGVDLSEININTMEVKNIKGLYITGELLDIDGICGGYNLTHSFITGYIAGKNI